MIIQHNITALNAYNRLSTNNSMVSKNLEKLSSGYRINRAGDDAAGLAISEKMRAQITGLERATLNAQDGISLVQTAEGALTEVHSMLNRMVELGTQSSNGTYQPEDRQKIQSEVDALLGEIDRISQATNFNGINLLDGTLGLDTDAFQYQYSDAISGGSFTTVTGIRTEATAATAAAGKYAVDLGDLAIADGTTGNLTLTIAGEDINIAIGDADVTTLGSAQIDADGAALAVGDIAGKLVDILNTHFGGAGNVEIGGISIKDITNTGGVLNFEQTAAPTSESDMFKLDSKFDLKVANVTAGSVTGEVVHGAKVVALAVAPSTAGKAHADIAFDVSAITNGSKFTIGTASFTFHTKDSGKAAADMDADKGDINLLDYTEDELRAMNQDKLKEMVAEKLVLAAANTTANLTANNWTVSKGTEKGSIHITQTAVANSDMTSKSQILAAVASSSTPKNANVTLTVDDSKLRNGSTVKIGDKTYEFTSDASKLKNKSAIAVVVAGLQDNSSNATPGAAATALATAAGGAVTGNNPQAVRVNAASVEDKSPMISGKGLTLQIGDTSDDFNQVTVAVDDMGTVGLGINGLKVTDQGWSQDSIEKIKGAIEKVSVNRGNLGALQNRLEHTINNLTTTSENMTAAESRVRDTDMAKEMMDFTKNNVLVQAAQAMLAQANQQPQQVLQLLR